MTARLHENYLKLSEPAPAASYALLMSYGRALMVSSGCALLVFSGGALSLLSGCASDSRNADLDVKLAQTPSPSSQEEVARDLDAAIAAAPGLSDGQRSELRSARAALRVQFIKNQKKRLRLEALLVHEVISENYDAKEIVAIEELIRTAQTERLNSLFSAVATANRILGHSSSQHENLIKALMRDDRFEPMFERPE